MTNKDIIYEFCKDCEGLIACIEFIRASEPDMFIKCPCFNTLKEEIK